MLVEDFEGFTDLEDEIEESGLLTRFSLRQHPSSYNIHLAHTGQAIASSRFPCGKKPAVHVPCFAFAPLRSCKTCRQCVGLDRPSATHP